MISNSSLAAQSRIQREQAHNRKAFDSVLTGGAFGERRTEGYPILAGATLA